MGYDATARVVVGVRLASVLEINKEKKTVTKYDSDTGKPYELEQMVWTGKLLGRPVDVDAKGKVCVESCLYDLKEKVLRFYAPSSDSHGDESLVGISAVARSGKSVELNLLDLVEKVRDRLDFYGFGTLPLATYLQLSESY